MSSLQRCCLEQQLEGNGSFVPHYRVTRCHIDKPFVAGCWYCVKLAKLNARRNNGELASGSSRTRGVLHLLTYFSEFPFFYRVLFLPLQGKSNKDPQQSPRNDDDDDNGGHSAYLLLHAILYLFRLILYDVRSPRNDDRWRLPVVLFRRTDVERTTIPSGRISWNDAE